MNTKIKKEKTFRRLCQVEILMRCLVIFFIHLYGFRQINKKKTPCNNSSSDRVKMEKQKIWLHDNKISGVTGFIGIEHLTVPP